MIYGAVGILFALTAFSLWRSRSKVRNWDKEQDWDREWLYAGEDVIDAPIHWDPETAANLEEEQINKEFEKLRKQLERRYAKGRRKG